MKRIGALLVIVFQLLSNSGFSFNQGLEEKPDYLSYQEMALEELQYVFSASLVWEGLEDTPLPTTVVTSEEIKRYGWTNLRDILEYQPSFYLIRDLNERVIAHRGVSFRTSTFHLSFEEDEVKLNLPGYRNFVLDNSYPLLGVSKIEVVRGGLGSLYGEVGFTGAVSVYRRFFPKKGSLSAAMGTPSYQEFSLGTETPPDYPLRLKGVLHYSHEPGGKVEHDDSSFRVHPSPKNYSLQLSLKRNFFEAYLHHYYNRYDTPLSHSGKPLTSEDKEPFGSFEKVKFSVLGVKVSKPLGSWTIKLHPYLQVFSVDTPQVRKTHREGSFNAVDIELMSRGLNFEGVLLREFERGVLLFGFRHAMEDFEKTKIIELRNGTLKVDEIPSKGESFSSFFAQLKFKVNPLLTINSGFRYDKHSEVGYDFSPRLSFIIKPRTHLNFLLSYTHGFQSPPFLYRQVNIATYGSLKGLRPEKIDTYTISAKYQPTREHLLQLTTYYLSTKDLISYDRDLKLYKNTGKMNLLGLEAEWKYLGQDWFSFFNLSTNRVQSAKDFDFVKGDEVLYFPKVMVKGGVSVRVFSKPELHLAPQFRWYSRTKTLTEASIPSYSVWDVNLFLRKHAWEATFKIENIFNKHYKRGSSIITQGAPFSERKLLFKLEKSFF